MHVCIVGTGASGWISAYELQQLDFIDKITIIGSPSIPTIGVGESTTVNFGRLLDETVVNTWFSSEEDKLKFLYDIDAAVKHGVFYKGWGEKDFLHAFVGSRKNYAGFLLGGIPKESDANLFMMPYYKEIVQDNSFVKCKMQGHSYHFDANKFISTMEKLALKKPKINHIKDHVINANFEKDFVISLILSDGSVVNADYFVSCVGQTAFNQKIFKEEYVDYSDILLTDKAIFYPLPYTNKKKQFHPYTVAKAMDYGWRWITPTWSRIGTGYVYSSRHTTKEKVISELRKDIGDDTIEPFETDFFPRRIKEVFKKNHCSIGMASGFLEPLDAPGLAITIDTTKLLKIVLFRHKNKQFSDLKLYNSYTKTLFNCWVSFILHQYKVSAKNHTDFWKDHKKVEFKDYNNIIKEIFCNSSLIKKFSNEYPFEFNFDIPPVSFDFEWHKDTKIPLFEPWMFYNTTAGRGLRWPIIEELRNTKSFKMPEKKSEDSIENHYDYFLQLHKNNV